MKTFSLLIVLTIFSAAHADVIFLDNGDRISGNVVEVRDGTVTFETPYAGEIKLPLANVTRLETASPRAVQLIDGTVETAPLQVVGPQADAPEPAEAPPAEDALTVDRETVAVVAADVSALTPPPPPVWNGKINAGATLRSGNTDTTDFFLDTEVNREKDKHVLTLKAAMAYGETDDVMDTRRYQASARWQYYPRERLYLYWLGGIEEDDGRKLDLRLNVASGIGYDFIKRDRFDLSADAGLEFVYEEWAAFTPWDRVNEKDSRRAAAADSLFNQFAALANGSAMLSFNTLRDLVQTYRDVRNPLRDENGRNEEFLNLRLGTSLRKDIFKHSELTNDFVLYSNLEDFGEFRLTNEVGLTTPLTEKINTRISLKSEYDSKADESGVDAWDNTLQAGVQYAF